MNYCAEYAIVVEGLTKKFGEVTALDGISFTVRKGEFFGFLGPNGAGKTTTINILTGLARQDSGTIFIGGVDCTVNPRASQNMIGVVPDESNLYPELTGFDNLSFCSALYGMSKIERRSRAQELLDLFGLSRAAGRKFASYSKGMKRKLTIAAGIIHRPAILFLDEPTTGIDVASARQIRQIIADLHHNGTTIFLTTHYIEEAERLCDRIAFIVDGRIVRSDEVSELIQPARERYMLLISLSNARPEVSGPLIANFPHLEFKFISGEQIRVESREPVKVGPLIRFLEDYGIEVTEARKVHPSLEEVFVRITGIEEETMQREKERQGGNV